MPYATRFPVSGTTATLRRFNRSIVSAPSRLTASWNGLPGSFASDASLFIQGACPPSVRTLFTSRTRRATLSFG